MSTWSQIVRRSYGSWGRRSAVIATATLLSVVGVSQISGALSGSSHPATSHAVIPPKGTVSESRASVTSLGGNLSFVVHATHAATCQLTSVPPITFVPAKGACAGGIFAATAYIPADLKSTGIVFKVHGILVGSGKTISTPSISLTQSGVNSAITTSWAPTATQLQNTTGRSSGVACVGTSFCVVIDADGAVSTYNGHLWSAPTLIDSVGLTGVSCPSATSCEVADSAGRVLHFNGTTWSSPTTLSSVSLAGVSCPTSTSCTAVTLGGTAFTLTGTSWSTGTSVTTNPVVGISCASTSNCVILDTYGNAFSGHGVSWGGGVAVDTTNIPVSVSCPTTTSCSFVDDAGTVFTETSGTWDAGSASGITSATAMSCASASACAVTGADGSVATGSGSTWTVTTSAGGQTDGLVGVSCPTTSSCVAANFLPRGDLLRRTNSVRGDPSRWQCVHLEWFDVERTGVHQCGSSRGY